MRHNFSFKSSPCVSIRNFSSIGHARHPRPYRQLEAVDNAKQPGARRPPQFQSGDHSTARQVPGRIASPSHQHSAIPLWATSSHRSAWTPIPGRERSSGTAHRPSEGPWPRSGLPPVAAPPPESLALETCVLDAAVWERVLLQPDPTASLRVIARRSLARLPDGRPAEPGLAWMERMITVEYSPTPPPGPARPDGPPPDSHRGPAPGPAEAAERGTAWEQGGPAGDEEDPALVGFYREQRGHGRLPPLTAHQPGRPNLDFDYSAAPPPSPPAAPPPLASAAPPPPEAPTLSAAPPAAPTPRPPRRAAAQPSVTTQRGREEESVRGQDCSGARGGTAGSAAGGSGEAGGGVGGGWRAEVQAKVLVDHVLQVRCRRREGGVEGGRISRVIKSYEWEFGQAERVWSN